MSYDTDATTISNIQKNTYIKHTVTHTYLFLIHRSRTQTYMHLYCCSGARENGYQQNKFHRLSTQRLAEGAILDKHRSCLASERARARARERERERERGEEEGGWGMSCPRLVVWSDGSKVTPEGQICA